ncbi:TIGR02678 family protein [Paenisporosarcina sp. TG20]|uniref:TIGR02678 family protein n=1 Tax=Paenisporosarcina sp. TG20 TaxID=1211706 RepID=UPI0002D3FBDD|nr:TIGR02678 family protein [Paenisporosarcina sp. TG20]
MNEVIQQSDPKLEEALGSLFEKFWVLRSNEPQLYQLIRDREHKLRRYISEKLGFDLVVHQHFIKLEKIPVEPQSWMGMQDFQAPMDYTVFCCAMAFTEQKAIDELFLLTDVTESIQELYPGEFPLDWTNYQHRKSLVRALNKMVELSLIKTIDGNLELFQADEQEEVLYQVSVHARYFMKSYPDDLYNLSSMDDMIASEWKRSPEDQRRKRVYRKLLMSPVVHREHTEDEDFAYIRNYRNRLKEDLETMTPFKLEVFKNVAMLTLPERKRRYILFPDQRVISSIALQVMTTIRSEEVDVNELGHLRLPLSAFTELVRRVKETWGHGWSKVHREESVSETARQLIDLWFEWELVTVDQEMEILIIKPGAARLIGHYPKDFIESEAFTDDE